MSFDLSKTETFIPFLWIFGKFVFFMILVSLFSGAIFDWSLVGSGDVTTMNIYDRLILVSILQFALFERKIDILVTRKNDMIFRNNTTQCVSSNINLFNDLFIGFVVLFYSRNKTWNPDKHDIVDEYVFYTTQWLWIVMSYVIFSYEILQVVRNDTSAGSLVGQKLKINENIIQVVVITMLTLSLTSPFLINICSTMSFPDFSMRVLLYTCYVCTRFYLYGISNHNLFISPLQNSSLFGWLIFVPSTMVYVGFVLPFAVYVIILTRVLQKQPMLPMHTQKNIVPLATSDAVLLQNDDFMTKLKIMEKQQAVDYTSNTKRRQGGSLF
jgi:hypothetical protein